MLPDYYVFEPELNSILPDFFLHFPVYLKKDGDSTEFCIFLWNCFSFFMLYISNRFQLTFECKNLNKQCPACNNYIQVFNSVK